MKELYSDNLVTVASAMDDLYRGEQNFKKMWAQQVKRNVAYANGDQMPFPTGAPIMVNNQPSNYVNSDSRYNTYITSEIEPIMQTLISYMTRQKPSVTVTAASQDETDKNSARVGERVHEAKYYLDKEDEVSKKSAFWAAAAGTVFVKDYWDYTLGEYTDKIDPATGEIALGPDGLPMLEDQKTGKNQIAVLTGLTVGCDHSVTDWDQQPYVHESYVMDVDWAREALDQNLPGYTGKASQIEEDGYTSDTLSIFEDMKFAIPYVSSGSGNRPSSKGKCLVQEWYIRPNRDYPRARMIIRAGGQIVYNDESPYFLELDDIIWHPYSMFQWEPYIGRFLGKSLIEQLIPLQTRLNEINGAILENANTLAKPNIMCAIGQLKKGTLDGKGSMIWTYQYMPGVPPPFAFHGEPLPSQFFNEKKEIIEQMVRIAGTNFIQQGNQPTGVTAAAALQMLLENANNQQSSKMGSWATFHEFRFTKKLRLLHKFMKHPDKKLESFTRTLSKDSLDAEIKDFVGEKDLSNGIVLKIQTDSMIPKSEVAKNQMYLQALNGPLFGPAITEDSPRGDNLREQMLEHIGLEPLKSDESVEYKKAKWENDRLLKGLPVEVSPYDNSAIHLPVHIGKIQDPKFLETATDEQKIAVDDHIKEHQAIDAQKQQEAMAAQAAQMPPSGMPGPAPMSPPQAAPQMAQAA